MQTSAFFKFSTTASSFPKLTREREYELATRWAATRDPFCADQIVKANMRYVCAIALKYKRYGVSLDDLVSEGNCGLMHALEKFEPKRGLRFVTYAAYWIRAYMLNYVMKTWSIVGGNHGATRSTLFFKLRRERARIMSLIGDEQKANEIMAEKLGITPDDVVRMIRQLEVRDQSFYAETFEGSGVTLGETFVAPEEAQDAKLLREEAGSVSRACALRAMRGLDYRERYIVEHTFLAEPEDEQTLAAIARHFNLSRERVRQLQERARTKMQRALRPRARTLLSA